MPRTTSSIETPACDASYSASMMSGSTSEFIFIQIAAGLPWRAWLVSPWICSMMRLRKRQRRHRHLLDVARLGIAGDVVEHPRRVAADDRIRGEVGQIGIDARGHRMIIAGAGVDVGRQAAALAAHHHRQLGVGLQFDESVDHLHAGAFEVARPADVGFLVEPRLQLDQRGHRLCRPPRPRRAPARSASCSRCGRASA